MNEAPKKIWVWDYAADQLVNDNPDSTDIPYIRADLVDGLVEALKSCVESEPYMDVDGDWVSTQRFNRTKVRAALAALKALEEE